MVKKLFWENPYTTQLTTHLRTVSGDKVTLEETIFYAFSGGQERDTGTIAGKQVLDTQQDRLDIVYTLEPDHNLQTADEVIVTIDWQRRYKLMRLHFAAEIVLELAYQTLSGIEKIGAHIAEDKSRIDFLWPESITPHLQSLQTATNTLIQNNLTIVSDFSDEQMQRRYWQIDGFARVACGGTHPKSTGEVGFISLKRKNIGKSKERIEITLV
ncbi:MAG: alanyl-tRNA editing protein [Deinococcota bacterium]